MDFTELIDLASERLGGKVLFANDDFFAEKENLLKTSAPIWKEGEYTDRGKWMDGWETRRRRTPGFDYCVIRLGLPGVIRGFLVDTAHFKGNYPERCSIEACELDQAHETDILEGDFKDWFPVLAESSLRGDSENLFRVDSSQRFTHLRFNIFPDGGVARLRVFGEARPDWSKIAADSEIDLAAVENGGLVIDCSDMFFGHRHNLIMPGGAENMSDGWETRRRRGPGHDWTVIRLGAPGVIDRIEVDTAHFKGNAPGSCSLEACTSDEAELTIAEWHEILAQTKLKPHSQHSFHELAEFGKATHVRFNIFPDGGVSRLRIFGRIAT